MSARVRVVCLSLLALARAPAPEAAAAQIQRLDALPDLVVDEIRLDGECNIVVRIRNSGGAIGQSYGEAVVALDISGRQERFPFVARSPAQPAADPDGILRAGHASVDFDTRLRLDAPATVSVNLDPDHSLRESNARNNTRRSEVLEPRCATTREGRHEPARAGWCCLDGEAFPSGLGPCRERGGNYFEQREQAQQRCRQPLDEPPRPRREEGWCCLDGEAFPSGLGPCRERGGDYFEQREEAQQRCRQPLDEPPGPRREEGWCCLDGEAFPSGLGPCRERGGDYFERREEAQQRCRRPVDEPPGPGRVEGWCCLEGDVSPSTIEPCLERGGGFFAQREQARRGCDRGPREVPPRPVRGWCCRDGEVTASLAGQCLESGGGFFEQREEAQRGCGAVAPGSGLPDLAIFDLRVTPPTPRAGQDVTIDAIVRNTGAAAVDGVSVLVRIDDGPGVTQMLGSLDAGGRIASARQSVGAAGRHFVRVVIDPEGRVAERNEENNEAALEIRVDEPDEAPPMAAKLVEGHALARSAAAPANAWIPKTSKPRKSWEQMVSIQSAADRTLGPGASDAIAVTVARPSTVFIRIDGYGDDAEKLSARLCREHHGEAVWSASASAVRPGRAVVKAQVALDREALGAGTQWTLELSNSGSRPTLARVWIGIADPGERARQRGAEPDQLQPEPRREER